MLPFVHGECSLVGTPAHSLASSLCLQVRLSIRRPGVGDMTLCVTRRSLSQPPASNSALAAGPPPPSSNPAVSHPPQGQVAHASRALQPPSPLPHSDAFSPSQLAPQLYTVEVPGSAIPGKPPKVRGRRRTEDYVQGEESCRRSRCGAWGVKGKEEMAVCDGLGWQLDTGGAGP